MGFPSWGGFLFGSPFVAAGALITLVGTKLVPVDPAKVHAPYWVLTVAGVSFAVAGLMVWGMAWRQFAADRQRLKAARQFPNEPALADYPWHPDGFESSRWGGAAKALGWAVGLTVFLSIFNWWAFWGNGGWLVTAVVVAFDCLTLLVWWQAARQIGSAFKFGRSRIAFARFPYRLSEPVVVRWQPSDGISQVNKGTFTLRCVEECRDEWIVTRRHHPAGRHIPLLPPPTVSSRVADPGNQGHRIDRGLDHRAGRAGVHVAPKPSDVAKLMAELLSME